MRDDKQKQDQSKQEGEKGGQAQQKKQDYSKDQDMENMDIDEKSES